MEAGPSRKRVRRSTRSCYQCRKRKVKCQLTDDDVETCAECVKSGTQCTLQAPETENGTKNTPGHGDKEEHDSRLERIESLLEKLVDAQQQSRPADASSSSGPTVSASPWGDILLQSTTDPPLPFSDGFGFSMPQPQDPPDAKQSLLALLPSAEDAVTIVTNSNAWLWGAETPSGSVLKPTDTAELLEIGAVSNGSPMHVAKTLLMFALYMQQLPATFDGQLLETQNVEKAIEVIVERVKSFVLSSDDGACSLDGIECMTLLSLLHLNDGAIRKAWILFRRTLDIARLHGLQNSFSFSNRNSTSGNMALRRRLWLSTVCGDSYCSLLLGLEPGLGVAPFGPDDPTWKDPLADDDANVQRQICLVVARIAQRNAIGLHRDLQTLQEVDEALDKLRDSMPPAWWKAPSFRQDRPLDTAEEPNRLLCQIWFFQARIYAHVPIAFGTTSQGSSRSLECCMEASRFTLYQYLGIQHAKEQLSRCRSVAQSVFVAAFVLCLAKSQLRSKTPDSAASRYDSDRALLEQVVESFECIGKTGRREHVAKQSSEMISTMLRIVYTEIDGSFIAGNSSGTDTYSAPGMAFDSGTAVEEHSRTAKPGMEDIIASSIQPILDIHGPASRLIGMVLESKTLVGVQGLQLGGTPSSFWSS